MDQGGYQVEGLRGCKWSYISVLESRRNREILAQWVEHRVGEVGPFWCGLLCSEVQWFPFPPVPGSRFSIPLKLCGPEKNREELALLHGGRGQH